MDFDLWLVALLASLLTNVAVVGWLMATSEKRAARKAARHQAYAAWLKELQQDPARWQLYQAHWRWKTRLRVMLATLLDVPLPALLTYWPASFLARPLGLAPRDDPFFFFWLAVALALVCANVFGALRWLGTTLGLRLCGIVAVSSHTGRPATRHELHYPGKWDYKSGEVLKLLFVPKAALPIRKIH